MPEQHFPDRNDRLSPERRPAVKRHVIDWERSDFSTLTTSHVNALGADIRTGWYFINPLYTVSSPHPTAAFFRKATWARGGWIKLLKDTIHPRGFRRLSRQLSVTPKQLQISGVMYGDGTLIPPPDWNRHARSALNPELAQITATRRAVVLADLRSPAGRQVLMDGCRAELRRLLSSRPDAAYYVTPALSLVAPRLTPTFLAEAREGEDRWHRRLHQLLGKERKALARSLDLPTRMLVLHGVLLVAGRVHLPGCWPDQQPSEAKLGQTPCQAPIVPPGFLGLDAPS